MGHWDLGQKNMCFEGLIGEVVGLAIEKKVLEVRQQQIHVGMANDTICLLLSGLTHTWWDHVAAGIVGTGLNFALFLDQHTLVNLESANFSKFEQLPEGKIMI